MNMDKSEIIDDYTIRFIWDDFHIGQWGILSDVLIYDEDTFDESTVSTNPIGTGQYTVKEYVVNSHLFLEARDDYWGDVQPAFKNINFRIMSEPSQMNNALETGMVDLVNRVANQDVEHLKSLPGLNAISFYDTNYAQVGFNISKGTPLGEIDARKAICHALDRQAIIDVVYYGMANICNMPNSYLNCDFEERYDNVGEIYSIGYDLELAKQLAQSSGLAGQTIKLMTNGSAEYVLMAEMVQTMLKEIDVEVQIVSYDPATASTLSREDVTASSWNMRLGLGINPGYHVASPMIMGIRTSLICTTPGAFEGQDWYLPYSYSYFATPDLKERNDMTYEMMKAYNGQALGYAICDIQTTTVVADGIDPDSFVYRTNGGVYYYLMKPLYN